MAEWTRVRIGDMCKTNTSSYSQKEGWAFVNYLDTGNITKNVIDEIQYIDLVNEKLPSRAKRKVKYDSVLFSTVRPNQLHYGIVKTQPENFLVSTGFAVLDADPHKLNPDYLYYLLSSNDIVEGLHAIAEQSVSAYPSIKPSDIENLEVVIPDVETQRKISAVLLSIDDKIRLNMMLNKNLEQQAQALFKSWFIDFEPFGGSAPIGWSKSTLGEIAFMKTDSWSPTKNPDALVEHYSIPAFDEKHYPVFEPASGIKSNKYILTKNSIMISKLNPDTKRIWRPLCLSEHPVCSTEFIVYEAKKEGQKDYIYSIIDSFPFFNHLCSHTTGSTNSRQRATPKSTLDFALVLPSDSVIKEFCNIVTPIYDMIAANTIENQSLAEARDRLLPKLMSGEIDVSDLSI